MPSIDPAASGRDAPAISPTDRTELPSLFGESTPVEFAVRLEGVEVDGQTVVLHLATTRYETTLAPMYGTRVLVPAAVRPGRPATLRVQACGNSTFHFVYIPGGATPAPSRIVAAPPGLVPLNIRNTGDGAMIEASGLRLLVDRDPFRLSLLGPDGRPTWSTRAADLPALAREDFSSLAEDYPDRDWHNWTFLTRLAHPLGTTVNCESSQAFVSFELSHDEHVYGLGESYGPFDKRGTCRRLWLQEALSNSSPAAYKGVPFYMTTAGHGVFVDTSNEVTFHVGDLDHTATTIVVSDATTLEWYVIAGPKLAEILPRYHQLTGEPALPPKWTFGLWMSRMSYTSRTEVEGVARELRSRRIPCDLVHIDTDWFEHDWWCDFRFSPRKFPEPAEMMAGLRDMGFRVSVWQWPNVACQTPLFEEGVQGGYLAKQEDGEPYVYAGFTGPCGIIDYSNPEAVAWMRDKFRSVFELGVAAIKTDFGEGAPADAIYHGLPGSAMHNLYPVLYNKAVFEATEEYFGPGRGVVWSRSAWAGSQLYPVHWSGDGLARVEDLACVLRSALGMGLSGFPYYSHDIGGTEGKAAPAEYVRWAQLGLFSSHARCHGMPPREPWAYGAEAEGIFRQYDELRYRLMPYIWSEAVACAQTGLPMMQPLVLGYQDDPATFTIDDEYLFGRDLLIAPMLDLGPHRNVYLPQGAWIDFWNGERHEGPCWIERQAALDEMPIYVRSGAVIPIGELVQYVAEASGGPLELVVFDPVDEGGCVVHDEARADIGVAYKLEGSVLSIQVSAAPPPGSTLSVLGRRVSSAMIDGHGVMVSTLDGVPSRIDIPSRWVTVRMVLESEPQRDRPSAAMTVSGS